MVSRAIITSSRRPQGTFDRHPETCSVSYVRVHVAEDVMDRTRESCTDAITTMPNLDASLPSTTTTLPGAAHVPGCLLSISSYSLHHTWDSIACNGAGARFVRPGGCGALRIGSHADPRGRLFSYDLNPRAAARQMQLDAMGDMDITCGGVGRVAFRPLPPPRPLRL